MNQPQKVQRVTLEQLVGEDLQQMVQPLRFIEGSRTRSLELHRVPGDDNTIAFYEAAGVNNRERAPEVVFYAHSDQEVEVTRHGPESFQALLQDTNGLAQTVVFMPGEHCEIVTDDDEPEVAPVKMQIAAGQVLIPGKVGLLRLLPVEGDVTMGLPYNLEVHGEMIRLTPVNTSGLRSTAVEVHASFLGELASGVDSAGSHEYTFTSTSGFPYRLRFNTTPIQMDDDRQPALPPQAHEPVGATEATEREIRSVLEEVDQDQSVTIVRHGSLGDNFNEVEIHFDEMPDMVRMTFKQGERQHWVQIYHRQMVEVKPGADDIQTISFRDLRDHEWSMSYHPKQVTRLQPAQPAQDGLKSSIHEVLDTTPTTREEATPAGKPAPSFTTQTGQWPTLREILATGASFQIPQKLGGLASYELQDRAQLKTDNVTLVSPQAMRREIHINVSQRVPMPIQEGNFLTTTFTDHFNDRLHLYFVLGHQAAEDAVQAIQQLGRPEVRSKVIEVDSLWGLIHKANLQDARLAVQTPKAIFEVAYEPLGDTRNSVATKGRLTAKSSVPWVKDWSAELDLKERVRFAFPEGKFADRTAVIAEDGRPTQFRDKDGDLFYLYVWADAKKPAVELNEQPQPEQAQATEKLKGLWKHAATEGLDVLFGEDDEVLFINAPQGASHLRPFMANEDDYKEVMNYFRGLSAVSLGKDKTGTKPEWGKVAGPDLNKQLDPSQSRPKGVNLRAVPLVSFRRLSTARATTLAAPNCDLVAMTVAYAGLPDSHHPFEYVLPHPLVLEMIEGGHGFTRIVHDYFANTEQPATLRYPLTSAFNALLQVASRNLPPSLVLDVRLSEGSVVDNPEADIAEEGLPKRVPAAIGEVRLRHTSVPMEPTVYASFYEKLDSDKLELTHMERSGEGLQCEDNLVWGEAYEPEEFMEEARDLIVRLLDDPAVNAAMQQARQAAHTPPRSDARDTVFAGMRRPEMWQPKEVRPSSEAQRLGPPPGVVFANHNPSK